MTEKEFREEIAKAAKLVDSWPEWKQNNLIDSLKPTVATPRTPVDNTTPILSEVNPLQDSIP